MTEPRTATLAELAIDLVATVDAVTGPDWRRLNRLALDALDEYRAARGLRIGDKVTVDARGAGLARRDYAASTAGTITAIGARGGLTVTLATGRTIEPTADLVELDNVAAIAEARELAAAPHPDPAPAPCPAKPRPLVLPFGEAPAPRPVIVVPCGAAKLDHPAPAGELYTGSLHRSARKAADRLAAELDAEVLILSALYGLVDLDKHVEPYNVTVGDANSVTPAEVAAQAATRGLADRRIIALGSRRYVALLRDAGLTVEAPLAGLTGIGYMRGELARIAATGTLTA